jgi:hypothetical protein
MVDVPRMVAAKCFPDTRLVRFHGSSGTRGFIRRPRCFCGGCGTRHCTDLTGFFRLSARFISFHSSQHGSHSTSACPFAQQFPRVPVGKGKTWYFGSLSAGVPNPVVVVLRTVVRLTIVRPIITVGIGFVAAISCSTSSGPHHPER